MPVSPSLAADPKRQIMMILDPRTGLSVTIETRPR
jgi:hypothetical protein